MPVPQGNFWGGVAAYPQSALAPLLNLSYEFGKTDNYDPYSQLTVNYGFHENMTILTTDIHYTKDEAPPPSVFGAFTPLQTSNTFRLDTLTAFTEEMASINDNGTIRKAFGTATYKNDLGMNQRFAELAEKTMNDLKGTAQQFIVSIQPFGQFIMKHSAATGGNSLGLDRTEDDRLLYCLTVAWENEADDDVVYGGMKDLLDLAAEDAKAHDVFDEYIFLNYATPWQDPIASYGRDNVEAMQATSKRYDPGQIFQKAVPGGFKLSG